MSDQNKYAGIKSYLPYNLYHAFILLGSIFTFAVGCTIVFSAVCFLDEFIYAMGMQVAPSQEFIVEMIIPIIVYTIVGFVLMLYSLSVHIILSGDDQ